MKNKLIMLKTILKFFFTIVIALIVIFGFVRLFSGEDDWICQNGEWIKHGAPSAGPPNKKCAQLPPDSNSEKENNSDEDPATIKLFFTNTKLDPEVMDCNKTFLTERKILKTENLIKDTVEALLLGPTDEEKENGFLTSIPVGVKIQSLEIKDGVARIDFDETLEFQVGGSCRVTAISSEIRETIKQFPEANEVIISINGRTEDILQP